MTFSIIHADRSSCNECKGREMHSALVTDTGLVVAYFPNAHAERTFTDSAVAAAILRGVTHENKVKAILALPA